jgi:predicted heme/steroid binding protein
MATPDASSALRQRKTVKEEPAQDDSPSRPAISTEDGIHISFLDILRMILGLLLLSTLLSYFITNTFFWSHTPPTITSQIARIRRYIRGPIYLTDAELARYDGTDPTLPIYLAINASIYDVSAGRPFYGPGGSYHFFAGKDATRAFVTGCFSEDLTYDLRGVEEMFMPVDTPGDDVGMTKGEIKKRRERERREARRQVRGAIEHWEGFFGRSGKYFFVGRVVGREGWEGRVKKKELCEKARELRPKRKREEEKGGKEGK